MRNKSIFWFPTRFLMMFWVGMAAHGADRALLISIYDYPNELPNPEVATGELELMRRTVGMMGVREQNIMTLMDSRATKNNILELIQRWLIFDALPEDRIILFISCKAKPSNGRVALHPVDVQPDGTNAIEPEELAELLNASSAGEALVVLNTPFADQFLFRNAVLMGPLRSQEQSIRGPLYTRALAHVVKELFYLDPSSDFRELGNKLDSYVAKTRFQSLCMGTESQLRRRVFSQSTRASGSVIRSGPFTGIPAEPITFDNTRPVIANIRDFDISIQMPQDGYLYVFGTNSNQQTRVLFPSKHKPYNFGRANDVRRITGHDLDTQHELVPGNHLINILVSPRRLIDDDEPPSLSEITGRFGDVAKQKNAYLAATTLFIQTPEKPEKRIALIIGNGKYPQKPLKTTVTDARDMRDLADAAGFRTIYREDADQRSLNRASRDFENEFGPDTEVLFYYSGHGFAWEGQDYLVPVDYDFDNDQPPRAGISLRSILERIGNGNNRSAVVIIDACRSRISGTQAFGMEAPGLVARVAITPRVAPELPQSNPLLLVFATAPGGVAFEPSDLPNGLFTYYLLQNLELSDISFNQQLERTKRQVSRHTDGKQIPWLSGDSRASFSFFPEQIDLE